MTSLRRLEMPRPARVSTGPNGLPVSFGGVRVEAVVEDWVVEDRWWTGGPLRRRYLELVLADGRDVVIFRDIVRGEWFAHRG